MTGHDLVSVIIPAFNAEAYLEQAIASAFEQDWEPLEVVVVDDGSTDDTAAIARSYGSRLTFVQGFDDGLPTTRNRGMAAANGSFFLHLDADDVLFPNAIRTLMTVFNNAESCDIAAGRFMCFVSPELPAHAEARFSTTTDPQRGHISGVALIRAEMFARVGPLDESYQPASDMEWWLRAHDGGASIRLIDDLIMLRRIHGNNSSLRNSSSHQQAALKILRESLKRKRADSG